MNKISAILVVRNEEKKIRRCLDSLNWVDEAAVIDQSSVDNTVNICKEYTYKVFVVPQKDYCEPDRALALSKAKNEWILYIDADEVVSPGLKSEIEILLSQTPQYDCYYIPRKNIFLGKWIKGSGWYPGYVLRLFRKGSIKFSEKIHTDVIPMADYGYLKEHIAHYTCEDLKEYLIKSKRYTSILARQAYEKGKRITPVNFLWKLLILPIVYFLHKFIIKRGFVDGLHGLLIACLTLSTVFMMNLKLWRIERNDAKGADEGALPVKKGVNAWMVMG